MNIDMGASPWNESSSCHDEEDIGNASRQGDPKNAGKGKRRHEK
jgi:hypothetical protein